MSVSIATVLTAIQLAKEAAEKARNLVNATRGVYQDDDVARVQTALRDLQKENDLLSAEADAVLTEAAKRK